MLRAQTKSSASDYSKISVNQINQILEKLKGMSTRDTTKQNYLSIWRHFNRFVIRLDKPPGTWEERTVLFCAHLVENGLQSQTIKSYVSAIKCRSKCRMLTTQFFLKFFFFEIFGRNIWEKY